MELSTLIVEIESILNARPLTFVYPDSEGISYPLTPADLIYGRCLSSNNSEVTKSHPKGHDHIEFSVG